MYWAATADAVGHVVGQRTGGPYFAVMQGEGNFVLYTAGNYVAVMNGNGTLSVGAAGSAPFWANAPVTFSVDYSTSYQRIVNQQPGARPDRAGLCPAE